MARFFGGTVHEMTASETVGFLVLLGVVAIGVATAVWLARRSKRRDRFTPGGRSR